MFISTNLVLLAAICAGIVTLVNASLSIEGSDMPEEIIYVIEDNDKSGPNYNDNLNSTTTKTTTLSITSILSTTTLITSKPPEPEDACSATTTAAPTPAATTSPTPAATTVLTPAATTVSTPAPTTTKPASTTTTPASTTTKPDCQTPTTLTTCLNKQLNYTVPPPHTGNTTKACPPPYTLINGYGCYYFYSGALDRYASRKFCKANCGGDWLNVQGFTNAQMVNLGNCMFQYANVYLGSNTDALSCEFIGPGGGTAFIPEPVYCEDYFRTLCEIQVY